MKLNIPAWVNNLISFLWIIISGLLMWASIIMINWVDFLPLYDPYHWVFAYSSVLFIVMGAIAFVLAFVDRPES